MHTDEVPPEGESLRKALRWLSEQPEPHNFPQVEAASRRFDLSPVDEEFLIRMFLGS
jgi:hypothetical protein